MNIENKTEDILQKILTAIRKAGEEVMKIYNDSFEIDYKVDLSPLTDADRISHNIISNGLKDLGLPIISEEGNLPEYETRKK